MQGCSHDGKSIVSTNNKVKTRTLATTVYVGREIGRETVSFMGIMKHSI